MKALICTAFGPIDQLQVREVPEPTPGDNDVLIDVRAAALNFPDALIVQGLYQHKPALPFSPGAEVAGVVAAIGSQVRGFAVGDSVLAIIGHGGFAERCVANAKLCMPLPAGMDFDTGAALVLTYGTSLHALRSVAQLTADDTLLVLGASGGVGIAAIEIAKIIGARVIAAASSADKLAACVEAGADTCINYETEPLKERVMALTDGRGADVVVDPVGGKHAEPALRASGWRARYLVVGFAAGDIPRLPLNLALLSERQILGVFWGEAVRRDPRNHLANMVQLQTWFAEGRIRPRITERHPLDGAINALQRIAGRQTIGKVIIHP